MKAIVNYASCKSLIYGPAFSEVVDEIRRDLPCVEHFICLGGARDDDMGYEDLLSRGDAREISPPGRMRLSAFCLLREQREHRRGQR